MTNQTIRRLALGSVSRCVITLISRSWRLPTLGRHRVTKHFIDRELIGGVDSRMLEDTKAEPPMWKTVARDNVLRSTEQDILLVVVRVIDDVLRAVKLPIVLVPGLKSNLFSSSAAGRNVFKTIKEE